MLYLLSFEAPVIDPKSVRACLVPCFENIENIKLVFSKNCSYFLDLVFFVFSLFVRTKKYWIQTCSSAFLVLIVFENKKL